MRSIAAPSTGTNVGARKCSWSTLSLRSTSTATLTTVNTHSSSSAVVPPSAGTSPTKEISAKASSVVKHDRDVRRAPGCMHLAEHGGQHVLAAHAVDQPARHQHVDQRAVGDREHGDEAEDARAETPGAPACTTFNSGVSPSPSSSGETSAMAEIDTST